MKMRIDKFLKVSRLIKRREIAKALCDDGDILINGKRAKPSAEVDAGDEVALTLGRHKIVIKVLEARKFANKEQADLMYEVVSDILQERSNDA